LARPTLLQTARDAARGRLLTLAAGLFAAGALAFTVLNFNLSRRTFELTEQGQVTDRFTKAIEQLGSDKADVRIGGIYALERIARDSAKDHPTVMEVLTAFIREHSREPWQPPDTGNPDQRRLTRPDIQAAVTVVSRRDARRDIQPIGLDGADLTGADLTRADLTRANLRGANLAGANLAGANLAGAALTGADLTRANLARANLRGADLTRATLFEAHLDGADLANANLTSTLAFDANHGAFGGANLFLGAADGLGLPRPAADLTGADLTGARLDGATWPTAKPVPEGWRTDESGRLERAGQLSEITAHYL
jgi:hypothetical protein